jgi:thymidylate kinase
VSLDQDSGRRVSGRRDSRTGVFVVIVGPDGVGKTTVARAMLDRYPGPTAYFHFRPPIFGRMRTRPPNVELPPQTKGSSTGSRMLGLLRLLRNGLGFWAAYLMVVRPALRRGTLVVGDRWAYGYLVQPYALKFYGPRALAAFLVRLLPRPDLVANLSASPEIIRARKRELTTEEIEMELRSWACLPEGRVKTFQAVEAPGAIALRILQAI